MEEKSSNNTVLIIVGIAVMVCCICAIVIGLGGYIFYQYSQSLTTGGDPFLPVEGVTPGPESTSAPTTPSELFRPPADTISTETIKTLSQSVIPQRDIYDLACRLQGICDVAHTLPAPAQPLKVGDKQKFWINNNETRAYHEAEATLMYITPSVYFWAEDPGSVDKNEMQALMDTFDQKIIPTDREFFGSEWNPGVDNDPHIYILYVGDIGNSTAGYFSAGDEYNPLAKKYSNGHEEYILSTSQALGAPYTYSTLAHEFVHMIQFPTDDNESTWMTEGFAELGAFLNGYDVGGWDQAYIQAPDLQLNTWTSLGDNPDITGLHYGQSFMYLAYFLDRFGKEATKAVSANPSNDLISIDETLKTLTTTDPQTGKVITADDIFMDWAAAMYLMDGSVGDGRYTYHNYPNAPQPADTDTIYSCPQAPMVRDVNQYGIDYIKVACPGTHTLTFTGSTAVRMLPADANSGKFAFETNTSNISDMTLTRDFDLTGVSGSAILSFHTWYDLEEDYDYVYVEVSEDGKKWDILTTPSGTDSDPVGNAYGWGYTGNSHGWIQEDVDLSKYAGKKVQVRFEYITDEGVTGEGFLLDDVAMDAISYKTDFEAGDDGWVANGFSRVENIIPQTFRLSLIVKGNTTTVQNIEVSADQIAEIPLNLKDGEEATLIVTGMTRYTRKSAEYQIEVK